MQLSADEAAEIAERNLEMLSTMVTLTPLLGIFGTVLGIIESFQLLGAAPIQDPVAASGGLAKALLTTAFGLAIAMPCLIAHRYFQLRALALRRELERRCNALLAQLHRHTSNGGRQSGQAG